MGGTNKKHMVKYQVDVSERTQVSSEPAECVQELKQMIEDIMPASSWTSDANYRAANCVVAICSSQCD